MKKTLLLLCSLMALVAPSALAQITFTASPVAQTVDISDDNTFTVEIRLDIAQGTNPSDFAGFDLVFEAIANQNAINISGLFRVIAATTPIANWSLIGSVPNALVSTGSDHAGYVQNTSNMGFSANDPLQSSQIIDTPVVNLLVGTYTFSIDPSVANGTYSFQTTLQATSPTKYSSVSDSNGTTFPANNSATFDVTVVPEPTTWSLIALGGLVAAGMTMRRRRHS